MGPDRRLVLVEGGTASFLETDVSLIRYNLSWFPRDASPLPQTDHVFVTVLFEINNHSTSSRSVSLESFVLRTLDDELHEGPTWPSLPHGRTPRLEGGTLPSGEIMEGWLTYEIPRSLIPEELLWIPREDIAFAIEVPWFQGGRSEESFVFGRVTDASGAPLVDTLITITPVRTLPVDPGPISDVGECRGTPQEPLETRTDESGWYEATIGSTHTDQFCIDVHRASDPEPRSAGSVKPAHSTELQETSEVRIDLTL